MAGFRTDTCCLPSPRPGARQAGIPSARRAGLGHVRQPGRDGHVFNIDIPRSSTPPASHRHAPAQSARPERPEPTAPEKERITMQPPARPATQNPAICARRPVRQQVPQPRRAGPRHPKRDAPCQVRNQSRLERGHTFSPIWHRDWVADNALKAAPNEVARAARPQRTRHRQAVRNRQGGCGGIRSPSVIIIAGLHRLVPGRRRRLAFLGGGLAGLRACPPCGHPCRLRRMRAIEAVGAVWARPVLVRVRRRFAARAGARRVAVEAEHPGRLVALAAPRRPRRSRRWRGQFGR
jgi:hypothetical protein